MPEPWEMERSWEHEPLPWESFDPHDSKLGSISAEDDLPIMPWEEEDDDGGRGDWPSESVEVLLLLALAVGGVLEDLLLLAGEAVHALVADLVEDAIDLGLFGGAPIY